MSRRALLSYLLAAVVLACPALCRAPGVELCTGCEAAGCLELPGDPACDSGEADDCVCGGATVGAEDPRAPQKPPPPADLPPGLLAAVVTGPAPGSVGRAPPFEPGAPPGHVRLRAFLAAFRC